MKCLITAGPTREFIDPVRYLSNPSSGKMGYALAVAARDRDWKVDLISGPVALNPPEGVRLHRVVSGSEMHQSCHALFPHCDILIMCAAVCDMRPVQYSRQKQKKDQMEFTVQFEPVIDILKSLSDLRTHQILVGFAAETEDLQSHAKHKLASKGLDWIVANDVSDHLSGFESDNNRVMLFSKSGDFHAIGPKSKTLLAQDILSILYPL